MDYMQDKIRVITERLDALRRVAEEPLEGFTFCAAPYKTDNTPPEGPWLPWNPADALLGRDARYGSTAALPPRRQRPASSCFSS